MTIKGTLETFNLPDLLQMLAFNQKAGTLVLETAAGARTVCVERGLFGFVVGDPLPSRTAARILRRTGAVPPDRLARAEAITANSGRYLGDALTDLGVDRRGAARERSRTRPSASSRSTWCRRRSRASSSSRAAASRRRAPRPRRSSP